MIHKKKKQKLQKKNNRENMLILRCGSTATVEGSVFICTLWESTARTNFIE